MDFWTSHVTSFVTCFVISLLFKFEADNIVSHRVGYSSSIHELRAADDKMTTTGRVITGAAGWTTWRQRTLLSQTADGPVPKPGQCAAVTLSFGMVERSRDSLSYWEGCPALFVSAAHVCPQRMPLQRGGRLLQRSAHAASTRMCRDASVHAQEL